MSKDAMSHQSATGDAQIEQTQAEQTIEFITEAEFLRGLEILLQHFPHYDLARPDLAGDIVLRRRGVARTSPGTRAFAQAFRGIMSADGKKNPRGGGWV